MEYLKHILICVISLFYLTYQNEYLDTDNKLKITPEYNEHVVTSGRNITLKCAGHKRTTWNVPIDKNDPRLSITTNVSEDSNNLKYEAILEIYNVTPTDVGFYTCLFLQDLNEDVDISEILKLNQSKQIYVYVEDIDTLLVPVETNLDANLNSSVLIPCRPTSPNVEIFLYRNNQKLTIDNKSLKIDRRFGITYPWIPFGEKIELNCSGMRNGHSESMKFDVFLKKKPTVTIKSETWHMVNDNAIIECFATGYPMPNITWFYQQCTDSETCEKTPIEQIDENTYEVEEIDGGIHSILTIFTYINSSGQATCVANNELGETKKTASLFVIDVLDGFDAKAENDVVGVNETVNLFCDSSKFNNFSENIHWYKMPENEIMKEPNNDGYTLSFDESEITSTLMLVIRSVSLIHNGTYMCKGENGDNVRSKEITLNVVNPEIPIIYETNLNDSEVQYDLYQKNISFRCRTRGFPKPIVRWYKDEVEEIVNKTDDRITISEDKSELNIEFVVKEDIGKYSCIAENKISTVTKHIDLKLKEGKIILIRLVIVLLFVIALIIIIILFFKIRRERKMRNSLCKAGLFMNGDIASINPDLGIDEQAELLPYDIKWEFPRENLRLGKQLGYGAFGVVLKAVAQDIITEGECTTVAVKTVRKSTDPLFIKTLISELKIMIHLGKHLNIVNLLGSCTMNIVNCELFVIVEYCRYGNLHNFLRKHRGNFIDQIDHNSDSINFNICSDIVHKHNSMYEQKRLSSKFNSVFKTNKTNSSSTDTYNQHLMVNENVTTTTTSEQPEWRTICDGDYNYRQDLQLVSTKDLISWSYQVASGLEYLTSRKVIHADLAARNVLLADNNIVKICDFGLAKRMYKSYNYKKKSDGPLPVKWMAVESIKDKIFSTQSDVWAYGILLWELFSLGSSPYPGIEADEKFFNRLLEGYRMEKPQYANKEIYEIMLECWRANPIQRPSFSDLITKLGNLLDDSTRNNIINLNGPYLVMNKKWFSDPENSDYLAVMSSPDYKKLACLSAKQEYVNGPFGGSSLVNPMSPDDIDIDVEGYLRINRTNLDALKQISNSKSKKPESIPMIIIERPSQSDDQFCSEPITANYDVPSKLTRKIKEDTHFDIINDKVSIHAPNNSTEIDINTKSEENKSTEDSHNENNLPPGIDIR